MLFQGIRPLECITTVIIEVRTLVVHIVHVPNVVFLATCLVRTLTNKTVIALASRCAKQKILHSLKKNCHVCISNSAATLNSLDETSHGIHTTF